MECNNKIRHFRCFELSLKSSWSWSCFICVAQSESIRIPWIDSGKNMIRKNLTFWQLTKVDGAIWLKYFQDGVFFGSTSCRYQLAHFKWHQLYLSHFWIHYKIVSRFLGTIYLHLKVNILHILELLKIMFAGPGTSIIFFYIEAFHFRLHQYFLLKRV